jgi:hypothetical protein
MKRRDLDRHHDTLFSFLGCEHDLDVQSFDAFSFGDVDTGEIPHPSVEERIERRTNGVRLFENGDGL